MFDNKCYELIIKVVGNSMFGDVQMNYSICVSVMLDDSQNLLPTVSIVTGSLESRSHKKGEHNVLEFPEKDEPY